MLKIMGKFLNVTVKISHYHEGSPTPEGVSSITCPLDRVTSPNGTVGLRFVVEPPALPYAIL